MPITRRYIPEHPPGDAAVYGMSFDQVVPPGLPISQGTLAVFTNVASPMPSTDFSIGSIGVQGRTLYASLVGGVSGTDYQLRWTVNGFNPDGTPFIYTRTALILCAETS